MRGQRRCIGVPPIDMRLCWIRRYRRTGSKSAQNAYGMRIYFAIIAVVWLDILADLISIWMESDGVIVERIAWPYHMVGVKSKFIDVRQVGWRLSFLVSNVNTQLNNIFCCVFK